MSLELRENISSFIDEELDADDRDALIKRLAEKETEKDVFARYCVISDAIKRNLPENLKHNLLGRVQVALESEPVFIAPAEKKPIEKALPGADIVLLPRRESKPSAFKPAFGFSMAASVAIVAVLGFQVFTGNDDVSENAMIAASFEPSTQQISIVKQTDAPSATMTFVADELLLPADAENTVYAEQSVIDDGQWTRITRIGDVSLRNSAIFSGTESHVFFDFQRNMPPLLRSVNLENIPAE